MIDAHTHVLLQGYNDADEYDEQILKESIPYRTIQAMRAAQVSLHAGFTTIRDLETEGAMYADVDLKRAFERGILPGPGMQVAEGADWIKFYADRRYYYNEQGQLRSWVNFTATTVAARMLRRAGALGVLAAGAYADLIAVVGDPLADVWVLGRVEWVMKGGEVVRH